jgi:nucleotide-binding universal stress UspA family protein
MGGIVCAIRGGPDSQLTIAHAIALARDTGLPLHFLYVVNLDFLSRASSIRVHTISAEMRQMGEFILLSALSQAAAQKVTVEGVIRSGNVGEEITQLCHEIAADYLVLGTPQVHPAESLFTDRQLAEFVEQTEALTGARVVLAERAER